MFDHFREGPDHLLFLCLVALAAARRRARPGPTARRLGLLTITFTLDVALAAARAGTAVVDDMYGSALAVEHKTATDFATAADRAAEQAILDVIRASRPDDGFEGEELGAVRVGTLGRTWLVDPLCGTVNFAVEAPAFCVNVALVAWVASGRRLAYVTDGDCEGSVHFSAGIAICQAAGCIVTDFGGAPVHTGLGLVAARDAETHAALLRLVGRHRAS